MINLGVKRKDMGDSYAGCAPCCTSDDPSKKSDYENEEINPELRLEGKHAELFGLDDLKDGDKIEVTLVLQVIGTRNNTRLIGNKTERDLGLTLKLLEMSDLTDAGSEDPKEEDGSTNEDAADDGPLSAILPKNK